MTLKWSQYVKLLGKKSEKQTQHRGSASSTTATLSFLVADDDPHEQMLFSMAVADVDTKLDVRFANDGLEALHELRTGERPDVVILDQRMPNCSGHEVLEAMAADEDLHTIPAVMFTSSRLGRDIERSANSGARWHAVKPSSYQDLVDFVQAVVNHATTDEWPASDS